MRTLLLGVPMLLLAACGGKEAEGEGEAQAQAAGGNASLTDVTGEPAGAGENA